MLIQIAFVPLYLGGERNPTIITVVVLVLLLMNSESYQYKNILDVY